MGAQVGVTKRAVLEALGDGAAAAIDGVELLACPYSAAGRADERILAGAWVRGHLRAQGLID